MGRLGILTLILATVLAGPLVAAPAPTPSPSPPLPAAPAQAPLEDVIARIKPGVVLIQVKTVFGGQAHGSGFIYDPSGYILTNQHVVDGATEITVTLPDRRTYPGTVVDYIRRNDYVCPSGQVETWTDVAVVKINGTRLPTILMGDSNTLRQGQEVLVLGYPGGVGTEEVSVSRGIIGAVRSGWLQTDATIVPGNSGGPVVDRQGRVVGLAAFVAGPSSQFVRIGGVVAINSVRPMAEAALRGGPKSQEFKITGIEYVPSVTVGRTRTWRLRYEPGNTRNQSSTQEYSSEVTQVQNFSGGFLYTVRTSLGTEARNWLDSDGLWALASSGGGWTTSYQRGLLFELPPCVGWTWRYGFRSEHQGQGIVRQATVDVRVEAANESVTVPAGSYSQVIKVVERTQGTDTRGGQQSAWRSVETAWWAPGVGVVRSTYEDPATGERLVEELVSTGAVVAAPPPPPPPAPAPAPTPAPQPAPTAAPPEATTPSRPAAPNDQAIVPGERVGAARVGDHLDSVIKMVGEVPRVDRSQRPGQSSGWIDYEWPNHLYAVVDKESRIIMRAGVWAPNPNEVARPPYRTAAGIEIGSPESALFAAYGAPDIKEGGERTQLYVYNRLGIGFYVPTQPGSAFLGRVYQIFVFSPGTYR